MVDGTRYIAFVIRASQDIPLVRDWSFIAMVGFDL